MSGEDGKAFALVEIAKRNGDFRKNYGIIIGAFLYLRSVDAAVRRRSFWWKGLIAVVVGAAGLWMKYGVIPLVFLSAAQ
jgi:hypothetical protein